MAVTIQQIAERAGVSRGTVDRALNHRGRINPEVAERRSVVWRTRWDTYRKSGNVPEQLKTKD